VTKRITKTRNTENTKWIFRYFGLSRFRVSFDLARLRISCFEFIFLPSPALLHIFGRASLNLFSQGELTMKRRCLLVVGVGLLLAAADAGEEVKKELAKFEGTWKLVSLETEQNKLGEDALKDFRLKIEGDKFTAVENSGEVHGTFKVDPTKKPKTIDITMKEGPMKDKTMLGIYELDADTYKLCGDMQGKSRPTEFAVKPGSGFVLEVLKREKK